MSEDSQSSFALPSVSGKKVTAAFDGGKITSDGGVALLAEAERRLGIADKLAAVIDDPRDPVLIKHTIQDMLRARMFAIACGRVQHHPTAPSEDRGALRRKGGARSHRLCRRVSRSRSLHRSRQSVRPYAQSGAGSGDEAQRLGSPAIESVEWMAGEGGVARFVETGAGKTE